MVSAGQKNKCWLGNMDSIPEGEILLLGEILVVESRNQEIKLRPPSREASVEALEALMVPGVWNSPGSEG